MSATSHFIGCLLTKQAGWADEKHNNQQDKCKCVTEGGLSHGNQGRLAKSKYETTDDSAGNASDTAEYSGNKAFEAGQRA